MAYQIKVTPAARRDLKNLSKDVLERIDAAILALGKNPRPRGAKKLKGEANLYRIRKGDYRIIYQVEEDRLVVLIVRVGYRQSIYR